MSFQKQLQKQALQNVRKQADEAIIKKFKSEVGEWDLKEVRGIWMATVQKLKENNITSQEQLKEVGEEEIKKLWINALSLKGIFNFLKSK